ncbi:TIGR01906 family membrane protein [Dehalogenimonas sp. THU2]|uniref:TIGR01906 family membrane protein n=1 Tax=Dehalogenimonas sp. THU2 TaxID=3151121 RepID=UPI003218281F
MNRSMGKRLLKAARWGLVLVMPLLITSAVIAFAVNFQPLYEYGFDRYDVGATTGLDDAELSKAARGLIGYFNSGDELIDVTVIKDGQSFTLFNEREVIHLYDVKGLIQLDYGVLAVSFIYTALVAGITLYRREPKRLAAPLFWGGVFTLALVIVRAAMAIADFNAFFTQFHLLSFANDFWLLNPRTDYLIMMFPGGFWRDAMIFVDVIILSVTITLTVIGWRNLTIDRKSS